MASEENQIAVERDVEMADNYNDEKAVVVDPSAEEIIQLQDLDPAMDRKMHLVNSVSL